MSARKGILGLVSVAVAALLLAACEPIETPPITGGDGGEAAQLGFTLTALADPQGGTSGTTSTRQSTEGTPPGLVPVDGELYVQPLGGGAAEVYTWSLLIDPANFTVNNSVTLNLDAGAYDFGFLFTAGGHSYGGTLHNRLIVGTGDSGTSSTASTNTIPFVINPILSSGNLGSSALGGLGVVQLSFSGEDFSTYDDPALTVSVNGGAAPRYSINGKSGSSSLNLLLVPGTYHLVVTLYDGQLLKVVAEFDVTVTAGANPTVVEVQPIASEVSYNYQPGATPDQDTGNVQFRVPASIVDEVGGTDNVLASASVVGPYTALVESDLTLSPATNSDGAFVAGMEVPGLTSGPITYQIQFRKKDGKLYAYCAQTVTIPEPTSTAPISGSFLCEPKVEAQDATTLTLADVTVKVTDPDGPVPGAVVSANDVPIGITSAGGYAYATLGQSDAFVREGLVNIGASHEQADPLDPAAILKRVASKAVTLVAGINPVVNLDLAGVEVPPPPPDEGGGQDGDDDGLPPEDQIIITAERQSWPLRFLDGHVHLSGRANIRIPGLDAIQVLDGDPQRFLVVLTFGGRDLRCWYLGGDWDAVTADWLDDIVQNSISNPICTGGKVAGDAVWVRGPVRMRVVGGSRTNRITEVQMTIPVIDIADHGQGSGDRGPRPGWWRGSGYWGWWGWWHDQDADDHGRRRGQGEEHGRGNGR